MKSAEDPRCPYCQAAYVTGALFCATCGTSYPWARELAELRGQIKERETNRLRATATLTDEIYRAARGEGVVSPEAVKGFLFSWLVPRALVVVGCSLIGAVVLGLQTYIMWSQTKLLQNQADAAQVDRAAKLRERLAVNGEYRLRIEQLALALNLLPNSLPECRSRDCADTPILSLVDQFAQSSSPKGDPDAIWAFKSLFQKLNILRRTTELGVPETSAPNRLVHELIDPASIQCVVDAQQARSAEDSVGAMSALVSVSGSLVWEDGEEYSGKRVDASLRFLQSVQAMRGALSNEPFNIVADGASVYIDQGEVSVYTLGRYLADVKQLTERSREDLSKLLRRCKDVIASDIQTLGELYPQSNQKT